MTFLKETINILEEHNKKFDDVIWIGCKQFRISKEDFIRLADEDYDNGFGAPKVAEDLLVVGDNWWLERHEYDGSEWWEFKSFPVQPEELKTVKRLITNDIGWDSLSEMNKE